MTTQGVFGSGGYDLSTWTVKELQDVLDGRWYGGMAGKIPSAEIEEELRARGVFVPVHLSDEELLAKYGPWEPYEDEPLGYSTPG